MNRSGKIVLILTGGLLALCLFLGAAGYVAWRGTGWFLSQTVESDPATVATVSDAIADYTLPAGFGAGYAINMADFSMVTYTAIDGRSHIYLIQAPPSLALDRDDLEQQMRQASGTDVWTEVRVVDRQPCQVRGQETTLVVSEGVSHDGQRYRSASALFEGNDGLALVNISGPANTWDQAMVETYIESLH